MRLLAVGCLVVFPGCIDFSDSCIASGPGKRCTFLVRGADGFREEINLQICARFEECGIGAATTAYADSYGGCDNYLVDPEQSDLCDFERDNAKDCLEALAAASCEDIPEVAGDLCQQLDGVCETESTESTTTTTETNCYATYNGGYFCQ